MNRFPSSFSHSLLFQFLINTLVGLLVSGLLYLVLTTYLEPVAIDWYCQSSDLKKTHEETVRSLQDYIDENDLRSSDGLMISTWMNKQEIDLLFITADDLIIFDSEFPENNLTPLSEASDLPEAQWYDWTYTSDIRFRDTDAELRLFGLIPYAAYLYIHFGCILAAVLLFIAILILFLQRKTLYLKLLEREINNLKINGLDGPVTLKGNDEITSIAGSIDEMRTELTARIREKEEVTKLSQEMLTEMSHDLRTPLTSIILYSDFIIEKKYRSEDQLREYLLRINEKAHLLKRLTDDLFEYSLLNLKNEKIAEAAPFPTIFRDQLKDLKGRLEFQGFRVEDRLEWYDVIMELNPDYTSRILGNIESNIIKYADPAFPVIFSDSLEKNMAALTFFNQKKEGSHSENSTGIGLNNIRRMVSAMSGVLTIDDQDTSFTLRMAFPYRSSNPS